MSEHLREDPYAYARPRPTSPKPSRRVWPFWLLIAIAVAALVWALS